MSLPRQSIPELCERDGCYEPVAWVLRWDERGAPEPAFACYQHGRKSQTRRQSGR